jgi:ribonuclease R
MIFNDQGKIDRIEPVIRNEAHRLIEECMLAANVCAANFLIKHEHPALYRTHEGPTEERLENLQIFLAEFGFMLTGGDKPTIKDYAALIEKIKGRPDEHLLQTVLLRSMQQAVYSPDNTGHFGLAYEAYAHFTSPIRRYPDLLIHRAIKATLQKKTMPASNWHAFGQHCSMTERRADDATRDVSSWLKCYYMQDKIGEIYEGTVAGVTSFGLFVSIDGIYIEGLLHVTELGNDYFTYDKARHAMVGERSHVIYRLGDRLKVKLVRVDLELSKIDFSLESHQEVQKSPLKDRKPKSFFKDKQAHKSKTRATKHKSPTKPSRSPKSKKKIRAK